MNRVSIYDPFADVFPTLLRNFLAEPFALERTDGQASGRAGSIRVDVTERGNAFEVTADLPGVRKEDVAVEVDGSRVTIRAELAHEKELKDGDGAERARVLRRERHVGRFVRSFELADELDAAKAAAKYENGVLSLTLPKRKAATVQRVAIG